MGDAEVVADESAPSWAVGSGWVGRMNLRRLARRARGSIWVLPSKGKGGACGRGGWELANVGATQERPSERAWGFSAGWGWLVVG